MTGNKSISELTPISSAGDNDLIPIVHDGNTVSITKKNFSSGIITDWNSVMNKPFISIGSYLIVDSNNRLTLSTSVANNINKIPTMKSNISANTSNINKNSSEINSLKTISHSHVNKDIIDKFGVNADGKLLWDSLPIDSGINFEEITRMLTTGTLTNISITPDSEQKVFNIEVSGLKDIAIDDDYEWTIDGVKTGVSAMGVDGYSPVANVTTNENISTITITDKLGTTTAQVISPSFSWNKTETGVEFIISDVNGVRGVNVDGYSPTVNVVETDTGYDLCVTDIYGTKTYKIYNGKDGIDGITTVVSQKQFFYATFTAAGWQGSGAPYTQTITLDAMTEELNPVVDLIVSDVVAVGLLEEQNYNYITKITTGNQLLTAYCYKEKPTVDINIIVEVD